MARGMDESEILEFWKQVADKRGGEASQRSFGRYLGRDGEGKLSERTGLVYLAAGKLWFETVESQNTFFGIILPGSGKKDAYEPLEMGIDLADIERAACVGFGDSQACVKGKRSSSNLKPLGFFGGLMDSRVLQLKLRDGSSLFFEASKDREIAALINGAHR